MTAPDVPNGWWEYYTVTDDEPGAANGQMVSECELSCAADIQTAGATCCS